jgi:hypothetical protein
VPSYLFGDEGPMVTDVKWTPKIEAADFSRMSGLTCWKDCGYCDPALHTEGLKSSTRKVYRVCKRLGSKCSPVDEICEWSDLCLPAILSKPKTAGWDDF